MASKYTGFLFVFALIIFSILFISVDGDSSVVRKPPVPTIPEGSKPSILVSHNPLKCDCEINKGDMIICANNGVTYANQCKFDCAQQKVKRLRKVKDGPCKGTTLDEFWKKT